MTSSPTRFGAPAKGTTAPIGPVPAYPTPGTVTVGSFPTGIVATNSTAYVTNSDDNTVSVIDLTADPAVVTATIPVGGFPAAIALSPDDLQAFVTNFKDGTLSIIDTSSDTVTSTVPVGSHPDGVIDVGGSVYVANLLSGTISIVDPGTGTVTGTITLTGTQTPAPSGLAASGDGHTLYVDDARNGTMIPVDLTQSPPAVGSPATVGTYPAYLALSGATAFVANATKGGATPGTISVLDVSSATPTVTATVPVGSHPYGVATDPSLDEAFVSNSGDGTLDVIDTNTDTLSSTLNAGTTPDAVTTTPDGSTVLVTNEGDGTVSILHVNQPPVNTVPGTQSVDANGPNGSNTLTFSSGGGNGISTSDPDAGSNPLQVSLSVSDGTLTLSGTVGLTFSAGFNGSGSMTFTGDQSDIAAALAGLVYTPSTNFHGTDTLTLSVSDQGNSGIGSAQTTTSTVSIDVNNVPPTAGSVSFTGAIGNTAFGVGTSPASPSTTTSGSVLSNSSDANGDNLTAVPGAITTTNGGQVSMNSDGTFTYEPPAGYTGGDTFQFQVSDGTTTSSATATVTVSNMVWYVKNNDTGGNDGRSTSPFHTLAQAQTASGSGDFIYVYSGDGTTSGQDSGITLKSGQTLVGAADDLVVGGDTLLSGNSSNRPDIGNSSGSGVTLTSSNTVEGLNIAASGSGSAISGIGGVGGGTISDNVISGASGAGGLSLTSWSGTWAISGLSDSTTGGGKAFAAFSAGTVNVTGSGNTLSATSATAADVENTTIGASNLNFKSITSSGADGIVLVSTGSSGSLKVTGDGSTAGSGGSISGSSGSDASTANCGTPSGVPAGVGVYLDSTSAPSLAYMSFPGTFSNFGILGYSVSGFTLDHTSMTGTYGDNAGNDEGTVRFCGLTGSASVTNDTIENGLYENLAVVNSSGSLNRITMTGDTLGLPQSNANNNGNVLLQATSATLNATVESSTIQGGNVDPFQFTGLAGSTMDLVFGQPSVGNTVHNTYSSPIGGPDLLANSEGTMTFDVNSNTFDISPSGVTAEGGVNLNSVSDGSGNNGNVQGYFRNNTIGDSGVTNTGSNGGDPALSLDNESSETVEVANNHIYQFNGAANGGVEVDVDGAAVSTSNLTFTNNTIAQKGTYNDSQASGEGFMLDNGTESGEAFTTCLDFAGNTLNGTQAAGSAAGDGRLRQRFNTKVEMPGYTGSSSATNVPAYIVGLNPTGPPTITAASSTSSGGGFFNTPGGSACPTPSF